MHHGGDPGQSHDTNTVLCADDVTLESMGQTSARPVLYVSTVTSHYSNTHTIMTRLEADKQWAEPQRKTVEG